jgi:hypothetical protein
VAVLDVNEVRELLFGDTDPREVALPVVEFAMTGDEQERDQRLRIIDALDAQATRRLAAETVELARQTRSVARWTKAMAIATFLLAMATVVVAIVD